MTGQEIEDVLRRLVPFDVDSSDVKDEIQSDTVDHVVNSMIMGLKPHEIRAMAIQNAKELLAEIEGIDALTEESYVVLIQRVLDAAFPPS